MEENEESYYSQENGEESEGEENIMPLEEKKKKNWLW